MPDPKRCLNLPFGDGDARGSLYQPLSPFLLYYSAHGSLRKSWTPWRRKRGCEPTGHGEACQWVMVRSRAQGQYHICRKEWLVRWEAAARTYRRPDGPVAWPYLRVSHDASAASGLSFDVQIEEILRFYRQTVPSQVELGFMFSDADVSAWSKPFGQRRGGQELICHLQPGDHILFYSLDRGWRDVADAATLWKHDWKKRNITPHFSDLRIDLDTPEGVALFQGSMVQAELQSSKASKKLLHVMECLRRTGRARSGKAPLGSQFVRRHGHLYVVPDQKMRTLLARVEHLRDTQKMPWRQLFDQITHEDGGRLRGYASPITTLQYWYRKWKEILATSGQKRPTEYQRVRDAMGLD